MRKIEFRKVEAWENGKLLITSLFIPKLDQDKIDKLSREELIKKINHYKRNELPHYFKSYKESKNKVKPWNKRDIYKNPSKFREALLKYSSDKWLFEYHNKIYVYMRYKLENFK